MRWVSNAFNQEIASGNRNYLCKAVITLADNETVLTLTNEDILIGGFEIEDAAASDSDFDALGSVIINSASLSLPNKNSEYSTLVFDNAEVKLYVGLNISGTDTYMRMGTYIVDDANYTYTNINLHLLDYMQKFDVPYNITPTFPTTLGDIVIDLCDQCAMEYDPNILTDFEGFEHELAGITFDTSVTTCRDVLHWIGQIVGCFFKCDSFGVLVARWFDRELLESEDTTDINLHEINSLYSQDIAVDDTVITGVKIIIKSYDGESAYEEYLEGSEGYVITIEDNALIYESDVDAIKSRLGEQLIGLTFRRARIEHVNDPSIESGDVAILTDRDGNTHPILITSTDFRPEASQTTVCSSQTVGMNSSAKYKQAVKEYAETNARIKTATISSIVVNYRISPSGTDPSAGTESWGDTIPTIPEGMYLWTRTQITYNNGTVSTAYSVSRNGESVDNLHFFWDNTGAHVTIGERTADLGRNVLITNNGFYVRDGTTNLASFTDTGSQIGADDKAHLNLDYHSLQLSDKNGNVYFYVSDLRDENGNFTITENFGADTITNNTFKLSYSATQIVSVSYYVMGIFPPETGTISSDYYTYTSSSRELALKSPYNSGRYLTAEFIYTVQYITRSNDLKAFTFGTREATHDAGFYSVSMGQNNINTKKGYTFGHNLINHTDYATVFGRYNDPVSDMALIIGRGTSESARSNALAIGWDGTIEDYYGRVLTLGRGTAIPANSDLNNYVESGTYYVSGATNAATLSHTPITSAGFKLIVMHTTVVKAETTGGIIQIAISNSTTGMMYLRYLSSGTWGSWIRFARSNEIPSASSTTPKVDGTAAGGTDTTWARGDHVHPTDTTRAPLASPAFTGNPTAPTQSVGNNSTRLATTEFVKTAIDNIAMFKTVSYSYSYTSLTGNRNISGTNLGVSTPSGYTPVAIVSIATGSTDIIARAWNAEATGSSAVVALKNINTSSTGVSATVTVKILYMNSNYVG